MCWSKRTCEIARVGSFFLSFFFSGVARCLDLRKGVTLATGGNWRKSQSPRATPLLLPPMANFVFGAIREPWVASLCERPRPCQAFLPGRGVHFLITLVRGVLHFVFTQLDFTKWMYLQSQTRPAAKKRSQVFFSCTEPMCGRPRPALEPRVCKAAAPQGPGEKGGVGGRDLRSDGRAWFLGANFTVCFVGFLW